jgi:ssDNA-binding Zn-finger/Zn-ribbon topoisomerase 1
VETHSRSAKEGDTLMQKCPKCGSGLSLRYGKLRTIPASKFHPEIMARECWWSCPIHGKTKSIAELRALGRINEIEYAPKKKEAIK